MSLSQFRHNQGFTLTEMLLVITIIAIVLGTIVPQFGSFMQSTALKNTASTLADIIRFARSTAIERSAITRIEFNLEEGTILLSAEADPFTLPGAFELQRLPITPPKEFGSVVKIAKIEKHSIAGSLEDSVISFTPDGTTSDTFIYLIDTSERVYTIGIVGLTGQVMVWDHGVTSFYDV